MDKHILTPDANGFGTSFTATHGRIRLRTVVRNGATYRSGLRDNDVVVRYGDGADAVAPKTAAEVRDYLARCLSDGQPSTLFIKSNLDSINLSHRPSFLPDPATKKANQRSQETDADRDLIRKTDAARIKDRRSQETDADRDLIRKTDAARIKDRRSQETDADRDLIRKTDAARIKDRRSQETDADRDLIRKTDAARIKDRRSQETDADRDLIRKTDAARIKDRRSQETDADRDLIRKTDAARIKDRRSQETDADRDLIRKTDAAQVRERRSQAKPTDEDRAKDRAANTSIQSNLRSQKTPEEKSGEKEKNREWKRQEREAELNTSERRTAAREAIQREKSDFMLQTFASSEERLARIHKSTEKSFSLLMGSPTKKRPRSDTFLSDRPAGVVERVVSRSIVLNQDRNGLEQPQEPLDPECSAKVRDTLEAGKLADPDGFRDNHERLLTVTKDVDIQVMLRFADSVTTLFHGKDRLEVVPSAPFVMSMDEARFMPAPHLRNYAAKGRLSVCIVRLGRTGGSGHFVVLATDETSSDNVTVYDSLQLYTRNPEHDSYVEHLAKVGAAMLRRLDTAGVRLIFQPVQQQLDGGDSCGGFAALFLYALCRGVNPTLLKVAGQAGEETLRRAVHDSLFCLEELQTFNKDPLEQFLAGYSVGGYTAAALTGGDAKCKVDNCGRRPQRIPAALRTDFDTDFPPLPVPPTARRQLFPPASAPATADPAAATRTRSRRKDPAPSPPPSPTSKTRDKLKQPAKRLKEAKRANPGLFPSKPIVTEVVVRPLNRTTEKYTAEDGKTKLRDVPPTPNCQYCGAFLFAHEAGALTKVNTQWCCGQGEKIGPRLLPYNADFYSERGYIDKAFVENIRRLNNMCALSALHVSGKFIYDLSWSSDQGKRKNQLCILDSEMREAEGRALGISPQLTADVFSFLYQENPLYAQYQRLAAHPHDNAQLLFKATTRATHGPVLGDRPLSDEIAGILSTGDNADVRTAKVWKIGDAKSHDISILDPAYEPLQYPLLRPHAEAGWTPDMRSSTGKPITQLEYIRGQILTEPRIKDLGRLGQEYVVDAYSAVEESRLMFHRMNQDKLRIAPRREIAEELGEEGEIEAGRTYLPRSFAGGPRYMRNLYQDGMAVVNRFGRPSLFITVTCNPKWPEIKPAGDPSLCARAFRIRLYALMDEIKKGKVFGQRDIVYKMSVIEFQKRGLPHAHIILKLHPDVDIASVDVLISAELPGADQPELRATIIRHNIHGPCGLLNPKAPCMVDGRCSKGFPKAPCKETYVDEKGYCIYRRRSEEILTVPKGKRSVNISDRDVVPFNAYLSMRFDCHINVELCSTSHIIKYLFKYVTKGVDRALNAIVEDGEIINEINDYINSRYISACEAHWCVFAFTRHDRSPAVRALGIHLEDRDMVIFDRTRPDDALSKTTELLRYLNRPTGATFDLLTYERYYEQYREVLKFATEKAEEASIPHPDGKHFLIRRSDRSDLITRIHWVSVGPGEIFFFRMLLLRFAIRSFVEARTVAGKVYDTFQEAARALGLATDEREYLEALDDAATFCTGREMRSLFCTMMIARNAPSRLIWNSKRELLAEDFLDGVAPLDAAASEAAYNSALIHISRMLNQHGRTLEDEELPACEDVSTEMSREAERWKHMKTELRDFTWKWLPNVTGEQRRVLDAILSRMPPELRIDWSYFHGRHELEMVELAVPTVADCPELPADFLFLDALGGSGKTLILKVLAAHLRHLDKIVICVASTGIAALIYDGGLTAHSMFKLPFNAFDPDASCNLSMRSERAALLRRASLIIYDEITMAQRNSVSSLIRLLRDLKSPHRQVVVMAGDYRQCPPVVKYGTADDVIRASVKYLPALAKVNSLELTHNLRARHDPSYSDMVVEVGNGATPAVYLPGVEQPVIPLPLLQQTKDLESLISFVYADLTRPYEIIDHAILAGTNASIDDINALILQGLPGPEISLLSADHCEGENGRTLNVSPETLANLSDVGVPPHDLRLKVGAIAMITRTLSFSSNLANSTKVIIREVCTSKRLVRVEVPTSDGQPGPIYPIPRINFKFSPGGRGMDVVRHQFPLRPAYAVTFNKSQGQTLRRVGLDLRNNVFAHGQLYVALSRVRSRQDIRALVDPAYMAGGVVHALNVVYPALISRVFPVAPPAPDREPVRPESEGDEDLDNSIEL